MPLFGTLAPAAFETAAQAISGLSALTPTDYDENEKARIEELRRRKLRGELGLTEQEESQLYDEYRAQNAAQQQQLEQARRNQMSTALGMGSGDALRASLAAEEASRRLADEQTRAVQSEDIRRKAVQEEEFNARLANQAERKREKVGAVLGAGAAVVTGGAEREALANTLGGAPVNNNQLGRLAKELGMSTTEAKSLLGNLANNPSLLELLEV